MKKRVASGLLAFLLVFGGVVPSTAITSFAAEASVTSEEENSGVTVYAGGSSGGVAGDVTVYTSGDFQYLRYGGYCSIVGYTGTSKIVTIPKELDKHKVAFLASNLLSDCTTVESIVIEADIDIPDEFCHGNDSLKSVAWKTGASKDSGKTISIGASAFSKCHNLTSVSLPENVGSFGTWCFGSTGIKDITVPVNKTLSDGSNCSYVQPPFDGTDLESVKFVGHGIVPENICKNVKTLKSIEFAPNTTIIGANAFKSCSSLSSVRLPSTLKEIEPGAFAGTAITSIVIPGSVTNLGKDYNSAFHDSSLITATILEGMTSLPHNSFDTLTDLREVVLPSTLKEVQTYAFSDCGIEEIKFPYATTEFAAKSLNTLAKLTDVYLPNKFADFEDDFCVECPNVVFHVVSDSATERKLRAMGFKTVNIDEDNNEYLDLNNGAQLSVSSRTYTGYAITPTDLKVYDGSGKLLTYNKDYTVSAKNNINVGTATVTVSGKGDYYGAVSGTFKINPKALNLAISGDNKTRYYNGTAQKPALTIKDAQNASRKLVEGKDYTVSYSTKCIDAGTITATVKLKGNYSGSATYSYTINPRSVGNTTISGISAKGYSYTGKAIKPKLTITFKSGKTTKTLKEGTDYTLSYSSNTKKGTATVTVRGKDNFEGTAMKTFKINQRSMVNCTYAVNNVYYTTSSNNYNGKIKVYTDKNKKNALTLNKDYTIKWDCKGTPKVGKHTVTITAKNSSLKGSHKLTVIVRPQRVGSGVSLVRSGSAMKVGWSAPTSGGYSGYCVKLLKNTGNSNWKTAKTVYVSKKASKTTIKNIARGQYKAEIYAYTTVGGKKYFSAVRTTASIKP